MKRSAAAFILAPLCVPLTVAPFASLFLFPDPAQTPWVVITTIISAIFTYLGVFVLGLPAFLFLRSRGWTDLWVAAIAGFLIGIVTWIAFMICLVLFLGEGLRGIGQALLDATPAHLTVILLPGSLGTVIGTSLWLIARPDRQVGRDAG
jgi:hypothetical protein